MVIKPTKSCHKWWRVAFTAVRFSRQLLALLAAKKRRNHKRWRLASAAICCTRSWVSLTKRTSPRQRWRMAFSTIYCSRILISLVEEVAAKKMYALHGVPGSSIVVDSIPEKSGFFKVDQESLAALVKDRNLDHLRCLGDVEGLLFALDSDAQAGIHGDVEDLRHRAQIYGSNTYHKFRVSYFPVSEIYRSFTIYIILFVAAYLLWYGIHNDGLKDGWHSGGYIIIFCFVSSISLSLINSGVQKYFKKALISIHSTTKGLGWLVDVVRNGMKKQISETQIVVGDIVHLETGDQIPADGLFLSGQPLKVNESSLGDPSQNFVEVDCNLNPFLFSRTNVIDGSARMLVTAVGMNTRWGNAKSSTNHNKKTPLQARVHNLETSAKRKVCFTVAFVILVVSLARFFSGNTKDDDGLSEFIGGKTNVADTFYYITEIIAVTMIMAEAMDLDSFSWVVMICLAHSIKRIMGGKVFIPEPLACETMASVSTIVTDKAAASMLNGSRQFEECLKAGVNIKLVTEEDISAASTIATECGILQPNQDTNIGAVIAGDEFRNYTPEERREKVDGILVMAQCSPLDKLLMVQCLKQKGHVIAVAGNLTDDILTSNEADVRISMRIQGDCLIGKQRSDIVTMDDNFDSVMMVVKQGRSILNNTQKQVQFQFTATVVSLLNSFISIITSSWSPTVDERLVNTLVQLIWVNQIIGLFAAMAFGTEQPGEELMEKPPVERSQPLVTNIMWRNMAAQVVYQIVILEILDFWGQSIFQVNDEVNETMSFVVLIFFQVFNMFNARKLDEKNIFTGILKNRVFIAIVATIIVLEVVMVELLHQFMSFQRLDWLQWMVCVGISFASWPIGLVVKFVPVPDKPFPSFLGLFLTLFKFKPDSQTIPDLLGAISVFIKLSSGLIYY